MIHLFFEEVDKDTVEPQKRLGHGPKTKYYRCYHGKSHILHITEKMKYATNGLLIDMYYFAKFNLAF